MIFPFSILSCLTLFVFWLPPDSGEKITLTITILLALTVFLQLISDYTPKASSNLPIIGKKIYNVFDSCPFFLVFFVLTSVLFFFSVSGIYFNVNLILVLISVVLTVVVLNFHYRGPKKSRVPRWCRRWVLGKIGYWLGFRFIDRQQLLTSRKSVEQRENANGDVHRAQPSTLKKLKLTVTHSQSHPTISNAIVEETRDEETQASNPSLHQHALTHNIEQILLKMQTQFDPTRIDDENLKISILREILECQRLLLTIHAKKQNLQAQSLYDIYEEWKILAIIVDRLCFIFYLVSMLAASIIFFVREPILRRNG